MKVKTLLALLVVMALLMGCVVAQPAAPAQQPAAPAEEAGEAEEAPAEAEPAAEEAAPAEEAAAEETTELPSFAMVASGALGDSGIFDLGNEGMQRGNEEFGVEVKVLEGKQDPSLYYDLLQSAAQDYDVVFVNPGYQFSNELTELAPQYPDTKFVYVDGVSDVEGPNILSIKYNENEGSYTAGVMAATMTSRTDIEGINEDKKVGVVGALDIPVINNFIAGFKQGVASVDPEVEVMVLYAGDFNDPAKGKELALSMYEQGADIVYNVAANTGQGVLQAASETGHYAIGVDTNQDNTYPGHIMGSMQKRVDNSFFDIIERAVDGALEGGQTYFYGLAEEGVGMTYSDEMLKIVPEDVVETMRQADQAVVSGEVTVDEVK
jgi:basic membrane protein A